MSKPAFGGGIEMHQRRMPNQKYSPSKDHTKTCNEPEHGSNIHIPSFHAPEERCEVVVEIEPLLDANMGCLAEEVGAQTLHDDFAHGSTYAYSVHGNSSSLECFRSSPQMEIFRQPRVGK